MEQFDLFFDICYFMFGLFFGKWIWGYKWTFGKVKGDVES